MGKRRQDAGFRRFFDEFTKLRISRFRATGLVDPAKRQSLIPFPDGTHKLIGTAHTRLKYGGGWSYFICPKCTKLAVTLYLIESKPLCRRCCEGMNIKDRSKWGMGREERLRAADQQLDRIIAKLETTKPLRLNGAPTSWGGKAQLVYRSRRLTQRMRRSMITLRQSARKPARPGRRRPQPHPRLHAPQGRPGCNPRAGTGLARKVDRAPGAGARHGSMRLAQGIGERGPSPTIKRRPHPVEIETGQRTRVSHITDARIDQRRRRFRDK